VYGSLAKAGLDGLNLDRLSIWLNPHNLLDPLSQQPIPLSLSLPLLWGMDLSLDQ
jgi:hypothetical protein